MTQAPGKSDAAGKGKAFFDRADQVAETGNWDFAIEMYLQGIAREPDNIERGHQPLRNVSLNRKAQGGKGPGMMDQLKRRTGKDPVENLVNAEYMLAKEPGSCSYMLRVLQAAQKLELFDVMRWIGGVLLDAQRKSEKRSRNVLLALTEAYDAIEEYGPALQALTMAQEISPNDNKIAQAMQELSAKYAIKKGHYEDKGDFTKGVKDMDRQKELAQKDAMVKGADYLQQEVEKARQEYLDNPAVPGKINAFVDALLKFEDESCENEAIDVLQKAHKELGAYQFKMRIGDIRIRQMTRRYRKLISAGQRDQAEQAAREQLDFELAEYAERASNYPTDLSLKYELGRRQFIAGKLDEAIGSLQQAQRDPRRKVRAQNYLGMAFAKKGWYGEAADTFERALAGEVSEQVSKEVRYNLGDAYENMGEIDKAAEQFSEVAQADYNYKDVRDRLDKLRSRKQEGG